MGLVRTETDTEVTLAPRKPAVASIVWLHGLGADGWDFVPVVDELGLPADLAIRFVFPHAPVRPVTVNNGYPMRAWYDIKSFSVEGRSDAAGLEDARRRIEHYLAAEVAVGVAASRIVLAGFSQGGATALHAGLRHPERLAGILAMSAYLPFPERLATDSDPANRDTPILLCHGTADPVVPLPLGTEARDVLLAAGRPVEWRQYRIQHQVSAEELTDVGRWLTARLSPPRP